MSKRRSIIHGIVDVCVEDLTDQLLITILRTLSFSEHENLKNALDNLSRGEVLFLMLISALGAGNAQVSCLLLSLFPRIEAYKTSRVQYAQISRTDLRRALAFARLLRETRYTEVPDELVEYMEQLLQVAMENLIGDLLKAAENGDLEEVESFMNEGAHPNCYELDMTTPLHRAALKGHLLVVQVLIDRGADLNSRDQDQWTPLYMAALGGHLDVVQTLIDQGADPNARAWDGETPLHSAANGGHTDIVQALIAQGSDPNLRGGLRRTPLHLAALWGHIETVQVLIDRGADLNPRDEHGYTPLSLCSRRQPPFYDLVVVYLRSVGGHE